MRRYETTFVLRPGLGEDQVTAIIERATGIITEAGGSIITLDRWGLRKLAYEIKKEVQGLYIYMDYAAVPEAVHEMERIFRLDDSLLRYLTIRLADEFDAADAEAERTRREESARAAEAEAVEAGNETQDEAPEAAKAAE